MTTPETYSHGHADAVLRSHRWRTAENSAAYLLPHLRPSDRLLDVGTGVGTITVGLAEHLREGSVTGIDSAETAVESTRALAAEHGVDVEVATGDAYALDFADDSFDVVHAHQVLQHLSDPAAALREMARVCRPHGLIAARDADYAAMTWYPADAGLDRWMELYSQVTRQNGGEPDAGRRLRSWVHAAGLHEEWSGASTWCFSEPADLAWWSDTWAERLQTSTFGRQAVARGLSTDDELTTLAAAWRAWAQAPDAWFAVLHGEVLARPSEG